jgi:hypothetical protein
MDAIPARVLSASERGVIMSAMSDNFGNQEDPKIGIFWYDETKDELMGVSSTYADEVQFNSNGRKTEKTLHKTWWIKQRERLKSQNRQLGIFAKDYTMIPRGRIFQFNDGHFELMCGNWINDHIIEMVKEEFNLQQVSLTVTIDEHWEIGHGWSEEYI